MPLLAAFVIGLIVYLLTASLLIAVLVLLLCLVLGGGYMYRGF